MNDKDIEILTLIRDNYIVSVDLMETNPPKYREKISDFKDKIKMLDKKIESLKCNGE